jgi:hypothetical protein
VPYTRQTGRAGLAEVQGRGMARHGKKWTVPCRPVGSEMKPGYDPVVIKHGPAVRQALQLAWHGSSVLRRPEIQINFYIFIFHEFYIFN